MAILKQCNKGGKSTSDLKDYLEEEHKIESELILPIRCSHDWEMDFEHTRIMNDTVDKGREYTHFVISFSPDDNISPQETLDFAEEFINRHDKIFKKFEMVITVHEDKDHSHAHIIVNQTKLEIPEGSRQKKFHLLKSEMFEMQKDLEKFTIEKNLEREIQGRDKLEVVSPKRVYVDYEKEKDLKLDLNDLTSALFEVSNSREDFLELLAENGIQARISDRNQTIKVRFGETGKYLLGDKMEDSRFHKENFFKELELKEIEPVQEIKRDIIQEPVRELEESKEEPKQYINYGFTYETYHEELKEKKEEWYRENPYTYKEKLEEHKQYLIEYAKEFNKDTYDEIMEKDFDQKREPKFGGLWD